MRKRLSVITLVILGLILTSCIKIDITPENLKITNNFVLVSSSTSWVTK